MSEPDQNFIAENDIKSDTKSDTKSQPDVASGNAETSSKSARKAVKRTARPGRGLAVMALLLSVGALGLSGYIGWRAMPLEQSQPALEEGMSQLQTQMARQQARLSDVIQGISPLKSHLDELQQREQRLLSPLISRVDSLSGKVRGLEGNTRSQWRLAEVEYLLRLANQRLLTVTDSAGSLELLLSADELLREMDDYSLFPIREALAEDIAALKAIQQVDLESAWLRLQGLKDLVPELVLLNENRLDEVTPEKTVETASPANNENWQSRLKHLLVKTWSRFTDLFRFTAHRKQPIEVLLSPEQDILIRQHLLLLIEQSKLALMTREAEIYQNSLEEASQLLKRYFTLGGRNSRTLANGLQALKKTPVAPELPNIHRSLEALKDYENKQGESKQDSTQPETTKPSPATVPGVEETSPPEASPSSTEPSTPEATPAIPENSQPASESDPDSPLPPESSTPDSASQEDHLS